MFFFFNDTATTEIYTLSLHDALPICLRAVDKIPPKVYVTTSISRQSFLNTCSLDVAYKLLTLS